MHGRCSAHRRRRDRANCARGLGNDTDRKSTRLNSSHGYISYAVFCLKKKKTPCTRYCTLVSLRLNVPPLETSLTGLTCLLPALPVCSHKSSLRLLPICRSQMFATPIL